MNCGGSKKSHLFQSKQNNLIFPYYVFTKLNYFFISKPIILELCRYYVATIGCLLMLKNRHRDLAFFIKYIDSFYRRICKYERPKININDSTLSTAFKARCRHFPRVPSSNCDERKPFISVRLLQSRILQNIVYVHFRNIG